jgi:hypothetical protein
MDVLCNLLKNLWNVPWCDGEKCIEISEDVKRRKVCHQNWILCVVYVVPNDLLTIQV